VQYLVKKGYYPLEQADQQQTAKIGAIYQVVPENQDMVSQLSQLKQKNVDGSSQDMYTH
jgi:hypothetical protein